MHARKNVLIVNSSFKNDYCWFHTVISLITVIYYSLYKQSDHANAMTCSMLQANVIAKNVNKKLGFLVVKWFSSNRNFTLNVRPTIIPNYPDQKINT